MMKNSNVVKGAVVGLTLAGGTAMAQAGVAQPDVADVVAYLIAGAGTILLVGNAKYAAAGAKAVVGWVRSVIGR